MGHTVPHPTSCSLTFRHPLPHAPTKSFIIPHTPSFSHTLPHSPTHSLMLPQCPSFSHTLPHSRTHFLILPHTPSCSHNVPHYSTHSFILPHTPWCSHKVSHSLPDTPSFSHTLPHSPTYSLKLSPPPNFKCHHRSDEVKKLREKTLTKIRATWKIVKTSQRTDYFVKNLSPVLLSVILGTRTLSNVIKITIMGIMNGSHISGRNS